MLFLHQNTVYCRDHRDLIYLFISCVCVQTAVFVSHCRRPPDFRLANRAALWSECPPGSWTLPFLLSGIPGFHFMSLCEWQMNAPNNFWVCCNAAQNCDLPTRGHILQFVFLTFKMSCCDRNVGRERKSLSAVVWWKIRNGLVAPGLRKCSLPDRKCLQLGDIPFLTWQVCTRPSVWAGCSGCCLLAKI